MTLILKFSRAASKLKNISNTTKLSFVQFPASIPTYNVMDTEGKVISGQDPNLPKDTLLKMYKSMLTLNAMDSVLFDAQRQGRISFYMTSYGEEAIHFGTAAALESEDEVFGQYREAGVLMWRGFTISEFMNQCYSNHLDYGKGRQMPVHYGSKKLHFQTISSPLGTQIPQAAGAAYALKREGKKNCTVCYFGEGAASEGDFHYALNFAATIKTPTIFICRNNGYAISTPAEEQYAGDGIASRGYGYGIETIRVDGNDVLAVYSATKYARDYSVEHYKPVLIEAMTYRVGHHSTSDDSSAYRSKEEVEDVNRRDNPIVRFKGYLKKKGLLSEEEDGKMRQASRAEVIKEFQAAEKKKKPSVKEMFTDVYDVIPSHLKEQEEKLKQLMKKYPQHYSTEGYHDS